MILVNGSSGGIGKHLTHLLQNSGSSFRILKTRLERPDDVAGELDGLNVPRGSRVALIHLAATVSVPRCEAEPERAFAINVDGACRYIESFIDWSHETGTLASVVYVSSAHIYAPPKPGTFVTEQDPVAPQSVYAKTKLAAENALCDLHTAKDFQLTIARVFGVVAPGQAKQYLLPGLIGRVLRSDVSRIPGLSYVRDYLDARDIAQHLRDLADFKSDSFAAPTVLNICSGVPIEIKEILEEVIDRIHGPETPKASELKSATSEAAGRPTDIRWLVGSPRQQQELTRRSPRSIQMQKTVKDAIEVYY